MYGANISNGITISKVLSGISKTLGIVNQALPIYKEIKPIIGNTKKVISILKDFNKTEIKPPKKIIDTTSKEKIDYHNNQSSPNFFL